MYAHITLRMIFFIFMHVTIKSFVWLQLNLNLNIQLYVDYGYIFRTPFVIKESNNAIINFIDVSYILSRVI